MDLVGRTEELGTFVNALRRVLAPNESAAVDDAPPLPYKNPSGLVDYEGHHTLDPIDPTELNASELALVRAASRGDDALYRRFCRKECKDMVGVPWRRTTGAKPVCG